MFGENLSEETITALDGILSFDREKIEMSNIDTLRLEIELLYDMYKGSIFQNAVEFTIDGEEVDVFSKIQDGYNLFMNDYEKLIDKNK